MLAPCSESTIPVLVLFVSNVVLIARSAFNEAAQVTSLFGPWVCVSHNVVFRKLLACRLIMQSPASLPDMGIFRSVYQCDRQGSVFVDSNALDLSSTKLGIDMLHLQGFTDRLFKSIGGNCRAGDFRI